MIRVSSLEFDCTGHGDGYYENPTSCSSFYICAAGVTFKSECHPGLLYSHASGYCDFPDHVTCHSHNPIVSLTTMVPIRTPRPVVITTPSPAASGKFYCHSFECLKRFCIQCITKKLTILASQSSAVVVLIYINFK